MEYPRDNGGFENCCREHQQPPLHTLHSGSLGGTEYKNGSRKREEREEKTIAALRVSMVKLGNS